MSQHRSEVARDLVITCIKGEGEFLKFWALSITGLDTVKNFESHLGSLKQELDNSSGFSRSDQIPIGFKCLVKSKTKQYRWCRAGVISYQGFNEILVRLLDYGNEEVVLVSDVRNMDDQILTIQPQAIECILADVMPVHKEWTIEAIKFCEQHLLYNTLSCYVVSEFMKLPIVRVAKKGESQAFVQRLINEGLALIKRETISPPPASLSYKINTLDPKSDHLVKVSFIENAHKFYVQLSAAEMELKHLMDSINRLSKDNYISLKVPAVNTPCLAQLTNKTWYRALITHVQQSQCKVFFIDYGFSEQKDFHELKAIPSTYLNLAAQAICCSLPREANINPEDIQYLGNYDNLELHVLNRTNEAYIVKLFYRGQDVLMAPPQILTLGAKYNFTVSYVNDLSEFYCQTANMKEQQNLISNILNTNYKFLPISLDECIPGKLVCAKFSEDSLWYRARIMKVNHENEIEVFFIDYGNYDNVKLCNVQKIGPDLLKFPIQVFKCFLYETPLPSDSKTRDDAFVLLEELTTDQDLLARINTFAGDAGYGITLYMKNSPLSINEKILSKFMSIVPVVTVDDIEDVYITIFDSCSSFYAQFEKLDSEALTNMQEEINTFYSKMQNLSFVPKQGTLVCAKYHEDGQYYRAKVEKCEDGQCDVFFIDYGNRESIPVTDVHDIDAKFTEHPQFGTECAFENFPSQVPNDQLVEIMLGNSFKLKMIHKRGDKWFVSFVENFPGNAAVFNLVRQFEVSTTVKHENDKEMLNEGKDTEEVKDNEKENVSAAKGLDKLAEDLRSLLISGQSSDVTLKVEDREFKVHRSILVARSPVFASMLQHDTKENATGIVDIPDCSAKAFKAFLSYIYTGKTDSISSDIVYDLYYTADKYQTNELTLECVEYIKKNLSTENFCSVITLSLQHSDSDLRKKAIKFFCENVKVIIKTVQWQQYVKDFPIQANELYIKAMNA